MPLSDDELREIGHRVRRAGAANCWTGTSGTIAADARRLVRHIEETSMYAACRSTNFSIRPMPTGPHLVGPACCPPSADAALPVDHILRGEAELRGRRYLGDEANNDAFSLLTEEDAAEVRHETQKAADIAGDVFPAPEAMRPGTDKFVGVLREIAALHLSKSLDYGQDEDALANIRAGAEAINVPAWLGCVLRMSDKMQRIRAFCRRGRVEHDGIEDTLLDIAAYAAIALVVYREASTPPPPG